MEDDVSLGCSPAKFNKKVSGFLEKYGNDYDAITFFGYWKKGIVPVDEDVGRFNEYGYSTTALAYMVNQKAYNDFLRVFTDQKHFLSKTKMVRMVHRSLSTIRI